MFKFSLMERVVHGQPAGKVVREEVARLARKKVFVVANRSLATTTALKEIIEPLGSAFAGFYGGVTAHAPRECIIEGAQAARAAGADLLLGVGGGSVIDACKVMLMCLRYGYTKPKQLDPQVYANWGNTTYRPQDADEWLRMIAVPTTFSAAEFTAFGGATETVTLKKEVFVNPMMMPQVVVHDPVLTLTAPLRLLFSTGIKAVDHAVERMTNLKANPYSDAVSTVALGMLPAALRAIKRDPGEIRSREEAKYGVFMSMCGASTGVSGGLSHAIAHQLGALSGVPHGETSCLLLPAVMHWLACTIPKQQRVICEALGYDGSDASAPLQSLISDLELPLRLRDAGVRREDLQVIAERTIGDPLSANCPRKVGSARDVMEILELAW